MESIWETESLDLYLLPYGCISTGNRIGQCISRGNGSVKRLSTLQYYAIEWQFIGPTVNWSYRHYKWK